jgi:hypothetical protein
MSSIATRRIPDPFRDLRRTQETKTLWYNWLVGTLRLGEVRFRVWSHDHTPRHVHAFIGSGQVKLLLGADGGVAVDGEHHLTKSEVRKAVATAISAFDELVALWEATHGN